MKPLREFYPFPTFRPGISEALDKIDASGKKFWVIQGRTGCGKSAISVAIARKWGSHILTATKILQDQYAGTEEFNMEFTLKGKSNYTCSISGGAMTEAPCASRNLLQIGRSKYGIEKANTRELKSSCVSARRCEYYEKRALLGTAGGGFLNYDLGLSLGLGGEAIVLDEAHGFIEKILEHCSLEYSRHRLRRMLGVNDIPNQTNYADWLGRVKSIAALKLEMASDAKTIEQITRIRDKVTSILDQHPMPGDFFVEADDDKIAIKPLKPRNVAFKFLNRYRRVFFLSATIDERFAATLGLPPENSEFLRIESDFPKENRPIYFPKDIPNINYNTKFDRDTPSIQVLNSIIENHHSQRGIIHTANYRVFEALNAIYANNERFRWVAQGLDKAKVLAAHMESPDSILVSPSMTEGIDLADDAARFQVILKVPFPSKTQYQEALEEAMPGLYEMSTINSLVQAYGRPIRSRTDWASTYVLDGCLKFLLRKIDPYFGSAVKMGEWQKLISAFNNGKIPSKLGEEKA